MIHWGIGASVMYVLLSEFDLHPSQTAIFAGLRGLVVRFIAENDTSNI